MMDFYQVFCSGRWVRGFNMNSAKSFCGEIAVLPFGYVSWKECFISELPDEALIWDSGRIC
jgi:hypothetical protein